MKEATGELNMTVITLVAVAAVGLLFYLVIWPMVQKMVVNQTCSTYGDTYVATKNPASNSNKATTGGAEVADWKCCPKGTNGVGNFNDTNCIVVDN